MRRIAPFLMILLLSTIAWADDIKVGKKATDFSLPDSADKAHTLKSFEDTKILVVWYEGKNSKEQNRWIKTKLKLLADKGKLPTPKYRSVVMFNYQETGVPNHLIDQVIKQEQKKTGWLILRDKTGGMMKKWGFRNGRSNVYVFDKGRVLRWKSSGPLSKQRGGQLLRLVYQLTKK